jgi:hypothetical protein
MTPTRPGAAMNVSASTPSTVACQPGSNATFSTVAPRRAISTCALNVPSATTAACDVTAPGGPVVAPMIAVTGAGLRPAYSTEGSTLARGRASVGRTYAR